MSTLPYEPEFGLEDTLQQPGVSTGARVPGAVGRLGVLLPEYALMNRPEAEALSAPAHSKVMLNKHKAQSSKAKGIRCHLRKHLSKSALIVWSGQTPGLEFTKRVPKRDFWTYYITPVIGSCGASIKARYHSQENIVD